MIATSCWRTWRRAASFLLGGLVLLGAQAGARADELTEFTGYTRPGIPNGKAAVKEGKVVFVSDEGPDKNALMGGTVYFTVIDMAGPEEDDVWGRIGKGLVEAFVPGKDSEGVASPPFDRSARYLYLYQTVNDMPQTQSALRSSSVLLVDPTLVTSWGYFDGHGFAAQVEKAGKAAIQPVSFENPVDPQNRVYRNPDREHLTQNLLRIGKYPTRVKDGGVQPAAAEDPVRNPDNVVLVRGSDGYASRSMPLWPLWPYGCDLTYRPLGRVRETGSPDRPVVRANWIGKNLLQPKERGALYGFTSPFPPVYDDVRLRGVRVLEAGGVKPIAFEGGVVPAAEGVGPAGRVPTPVPPAAEAVGAVGGGLLGGGLLTGGGGAVGGGLPIGGAGLLPALSVPAGGGFGTSGGSGTQRQGPQQTQSQTQPQSQSGNNVTINGPFQQQQQSTSCPCPPGNVVPAPPSALLALIGAPFLLLFWRWRVGRVVSH